MFAVFSSSLDRDAVPDFIVAEKRRGHLPSRHRLLHGYVLQPDVSSKIDRPTTPLSDLPSSHHLNAFDYHYILNYHRRRMYFIAHYYDAHLCTVDSSLRTRVAPILLFLTCIDIFCHPAE